MRNADIAHQWAHQRKSSGEGSNFYFEGDTIYSYGPHFPIAALKRGKDGQMYAIVTRESYSVTTSTHVNHVVSAIDTYTTPIIWVPGHDFTRPTFARFKERMKSMAEGVVQAIEKYDRARVHKYPEHVDETIENVLRYARFAGFKITPAVKKVIAFWEAGEAERKPDYEEQLKREAKQQAALKKKVAKGVEGWREGKEPYPSEARRLGVAHMRCVQGYTFDGQLPLEKNRRALGKMVETSLGVTIPLGEIERVWPLAKRLIAGKKVEIPAGLRIDGWPVHMATSKAVQIGCHKITVYELAAFGQHAGL